MVVLAAVASFGAFAARIMSVHSGDRRLVSLSTWLSLLTFGVVSAALMLLAYLFLTADTGYYYVWSSISTDLPAIYKLSGMWSGAEGSFLLWIWFMTLVLAVEVVLEPRRDYLSSSFHGIFQAVLSGTVFIFVVLLADMGLFRETAPILLQSAPDGYGMELVLQTPEMLIHPPVVFAGYGFCVAAMAAAIAYFRTGQGGWTTISLFWGRLAWIFLTLGIGIGAIWAYYVLGWGGYWAWDPVETSSLLPWLIVTAFLHTQLRHARKGEYPIVSPALGLTSFVAVVFATFTTRAGSIWTSSVHAFGSSAGDTAAARLTYLLQNDGSVLGIFLLMVGLFALTVYLSYEKYRSLGPREEEPEPEKWSEYISDRGNMLLTVALLIATSAVMLLLLFKNVNVAQVANYTEFNQKMSLFFVLLMVTMTVCLIWKFLGKDVAFWLGLGMVAVSVGLSAAAAVAGSFDWLVAFSAPSYLVAVGASVWRLARSRVKGSLRKTLQKASPQLIHLGVALVLVSYVVSSNMQSYPSDLERMRDMSGTVLNIGDSVEAGGYTLTLTGLRSVPESRSSGGGVVNEAKEAVVDISRSGDRVASGVVLTNLYGRSFSGSPQVLDIDVYVQKSVTDDFYVHFQWLNDTAAFLQVKVVPAMNFLWGGFGLMVIGLAIRAMVWKAEPKESVVPARKPAGPRAAPSKETPTPSKEEKEYEALVEEQLRRFKERRGK